MERQNLNSCLTRPRFLKTSAAAMVGAAALDRIACFGAPGAVVGDESPAYTFGIDQDRLHGAPDFSRTQMHL
jgi:hypothetical protein